MAIIIKEFLKQRIRKHIEQMDEYKTIMSSFPVTKNRKPPKKPKLTLIIRRKDIKKIMKDGRHLARELLLVTLREKERREETERRKIVNNDD
jgi:aspartyl/asparaginyl beta-hydroxylase (cupin superfamily)